ncbi:hypothetical protein PIB30_085824 [Stylosanthes scabra]|uniref:Uncharacterized protein n=1 Tax=Stylosanthes scabra TaxID=79078 RepID=A0ABU6UVI7_9FABA|nr:hypothetical protein [Stylosanthes scabra]
MSSPPPPLPHRGETSSRNFREGPGTINQAMIEKIFGLINEERFREFLRNSDEWSKLTIKCRLFFEYQMEKDKKELEAARSALMEFQSLKESHDRVVEGGQGNLASN